MAIGAPRSKQSHARLDGIGVSIERVVRRRWCLRTQQRFACQAGRRHQQRRNSRSHVPCLHEKGGQWPSL
jgi:hypothetical protein